MSPSVADDFASWTRPVGGEGLGVIDFEIFPHLDNPDLPENTMADAERRAGWPDWVRLRDLDDETAIKVIDGVADVISEGTGGCSNRLPLLLPAVETPKSRNQREVDSGPPVPRF